MVIYLLKLDRIDRLASMNVCCRVPQKKISQKNVHDKKWQYQPKNSSFLVNLGKCVKKLSSFSHSSRFLHDIKNFSRKFRRSGVIWPKLLNTSNIPIISNIPLVLKCTMCLILTVTKNLGHLWINTSMLGISTSIRLLLVPSKSHNIPRNNPLFK